MMTEGDPMIERAEEEMEKGQGYIFDLEVVEDVPVPGTDELPPLSIVICFLQDEEEGKPEVKVSANMPVADIERGLATALEALNEWWKQTAPELIANNIAQNKDEIPAQIGERDDSFVNQRWTPFAETDEDDNEGADQ